MTEPNSIEDRKEIVLVAGLGDGEPKDDNPLEISTPKKAGRRKINIEYIEDKSRRHITFSKRKAGIMKKAYELSTLTGTQVLLLVASETGHVYTFATQKLQPLITKNEGKNLIQACLNAPDNGQPNQQPSTQRIPHTNNPPPSSNNNNSNNNNNNNNNGGGGGSSSSSNHNSNNPYSDSLIYPPSQSNELSQREHVSVYEDEKKDHKDFSSLPMPEMNPYQQYNTAGMLRSPHYTNHPGSINPMQMRPGYPTMPQPQSSPNFPGYAPQQMGMPQYQQPQSYAQPSPSGYPNWPPNTGPKSQVGMPQSHGSSQLSPIIQK